MVHLLNYRPVRIKSNARDNPISAGNLTVPLERKTKVIFIRNQDIAKKKNCVLVS